MREVPSDWSERVPKGISPKRQVVFFRKAFHDGLLTNGFTCLGEHDSEEKRPSAMALLDMCRYFRITKEGILQTVELYLEQIDETKGTFDRYARGGFVSVHMWALVDWIPMQKPVYCWGWGRSQQAVTHFHFPNMEESFCASFIDLFCDDFPYAIELEKDLFFEQTLPWLEQHSTLEQYANWRMSFIENGSAYWLALTTVWSQLQLQRWEKAVICVNYCLDYWAWYTGEERRTKPEEYPAGSREAVLCKILQLIKQNDKAAIEDLLEANRVQNEANFEKGLPKLYYQLTK